jgi:hypothetical protein
VFDEVNIQEHPAFADLRAGDFSGASFLLQRYRMDVQECGRCVQIERVHARILLAGVAIKPYRPK